MSRLDQAGGITPHEPLNPKPFTNLPPDTQRE